MIDCTALEGYTVASYWWKKLIVADAFNNNYSKLSNKTISNTDTTAAQMQFSNVHSYSDIHKATHSSSTFVFYTSSVHSTA